MNMNWKIVKLIGALVVIIGVIFWAVTAILPQSYSGTDLNFEVGSGGVVITNPSEQTIPVELTGTRSFRVTSELEGITGSSTREGSGSTSAYVYNFELPAGRSEFIVESRSATVTFVATSSSELVITTYPMTSEASRNALIAMTVVILGMLLYASSVVEHSWIGFLRGKNSGSEGTQPSPAVESAQGQDIRSFGDNRTYRP